jgi:hypothetical protein
MSRGKETAFFKASTYDITLTAISGGVLLPMKMPIGPRKAAKLSSV